MSLCPQCQSQNRDGAAICRTCGTPLVAKGPRMCPSGRHPMDPSWTDCPYCRNAGAPQEVGAGRPRTMVEPEAPAGRGRQRTMIEESGGGPAPLLQPQGQSRRGGTKFMSEGAESAPPDPLAVSRPVAVRKIVAVLATYSWKPEGQVFPIYEGRNFIGSSTECEVSLGSDPQMSGKHATLIYRNGIFMLDDANSMNGTFLNELDVLEKQRLTNYVQFRTGATVWQFIVIDPAGMAAGQ